MSIGERIAELRKNNNLSQEQLAEKIYVSRQTISKWEQNLATPDVENIKMLSNFFLVSSDYLINGKENSQKKKSFTDVLILICGIVVIVAYIIILLVNKEELTTPSSIIEINAYGILAIVGVALIVIAAILIIKRRKK